MNNKGIATVVAASLILAAIVTVAITYQAFIVPEQNRQIAFSHTQDVLKSFEGLYSEGYSTFSLSYSGSSFFSSASFPGQLSYSPSTRVKVDLSNVTELTPTQLLLANQTGDFPIRELSEATLTFENVTENFYGNYNFTHNQQKIVVEVNTETIALTDNTEVMRIFLNITSSYGSSSYGYSLFSGDSLHLQLFSPLYGLASDLSQTSSIEYQTDSSSCMLFIQYLAINNTDLTYSARGAIMYKPTSFPLSYIATPWGVTALEAGTSSIPAPIQIRWAQNMLCLDLYNITWKNIGTISGSGAAAIKFNEYNTTCLQSSFDSISMNFTSSDCNINNSIMQLHTMLKNNAPDDAIISIEQNLTWVTLTITSHKTVSLTIHAVDAVLS
ncbi:MAG: hypothetical protein ACFCUE_00260 [Candidatus Bathyarchaeia archaeon]|jgi:hypothetical protein